MQHTDIWWCWGRWGFVGDAISRHDEQNIFWIVSKQIKKIAKCSSNFDVDSTCALVASSPGQREKNRPQSLQKNMIPVPFPNLLKPFGCFCRLTFMPFDEFCGRAARDASSAGEKETPLVLIGSLPEQDSRSHRRASPLLPSVFGQYSGPLTVHFHGSPRH